MDRLMQGQGEIIECSSRFIFSHFRTATQAIWLVGGVVKMFCLRHFCFCAGTLTSD